MDQEKYEINKEKLKTYVLVAVLIILAVIGVVWAKGTFFSQPVTAAATGLEGSNLRVATLELPGMFCAACAYSSENTLKRIPGVVSADVSIANRQGIVVYDTYKTSKESLVEPGLIKAYEGKVIDDQKYDG